MFVTKNFHKFARKQHISDIVLLERIESVERGQIDAVLGGCLIKLRIARENQGKSSGFRALVAFRSGDKAFYLFGFGKNDRGNIEPHEQTQLESFGRLLLDLTEAELRLAIDGGELRELEQDERNE